MLLCKVYHTTILDASKIRADCENSFIGRLRVVSTRITPTLITTIRLINDYNDYNNLGICPGYINETLLTIGQNYVPARHHLNTLSVLHLQRFSTLNRTQTDVNISFTSA